MAPASNYSFGIINLTNDQFFQYRFNISAGTPPQQLSMILDISCPQSWLYTGQQSGYHSQQSSSYNQTTQSQTINYGINETISGFKGTEQFTLLNLSLQSIQQNVTFVSQQPIFNGKNDISGVYSLANTQNFKNLLEIGAENNILPDSRFALQLSELKLFISTFSFPVWAEPLWVDCLNSTNWEMQASSVSINGVTIALSKPIAMDTSISIILIEDQAFSQFQANQIVKQYCQQNSTGDYVCYCGADQINKFPNLTFIFQNGGFDIMPQDYLLNLGNDYCYLGIGSTGQQQSEMIFGDVFLKNYFIAFDKENQQIGLAHNQVKIYNLSNYDHPLPTDFAQSSQYETIVILGTNDIHGHIHPKYQSSPEQNTTIEGEYGIGGTLLLSNYIKQLQNEWKEKLIWLDAGDQFTGTLESQLFDGAPMTVFYETNGLTASAVGNHEFDAGLQNLENIIANSTFPWLAANLYNASTLQFVKWKHLLQTWSGMIGGIKVGVIGLITDETPDTSSANLSSLIFEPYKNITVELSQELRNNGSQIIVLTCHIGMNCSDPGDKLTLRMRNSTNSIEQNCTGELHDFLTSLPNKTVDVVIGGHIHDIIHTWINGMPVVVGKDYAQYFNLIYVTYDKQNNKVVNTSVEGPVPVCTKIFDKSRICNIEQDQVNKSLGNLTQFSFHNFTINKDRIYQRLVANYTAKAKVLGDKFIANIMNPMFTSSTVECPLGDFFTDAMVNQTHADVSILNPYSIRTNWSVGNLTYALLFETDPFNDGTETCQMTGAELLQTMQVLQAGDLGFYQTSGLEMNVSLNPRKLLSIKFYNGSSIEPTQNYTVASTQYCWNGGDDFNKVRQFYTPRDVVKYGETRDLFENYAKEVMNLNPSNDPVVKPNHPRLTVIK